MEKTARKPSADPAQERLRQTKANWNKEVSAFINDLIHFKKMMNGWPSKFFKERSRITQPIPADPATIIGSLAGDFQEIASRGNGIIQEQINYAKTRRQKQPKAPAPTPTGPTTPAAALPVPEAPKPDLAQQLGKAVAASSYASDEYLISEASNPLTRFFHGLLHPGIGGSEAARVRKYRNSLLNATAQLYKDLKLVQKAVVGSGPQSIFEAGQLLNRAEENFVVLFSGVQAFIETLPQGVADTGGNIPSPPDTGEDEGEPPAPPPAGADFLNQPNVLAALAAITDIQTYGNTFKGTIGLPALRELSKKFSLATPAEKAQMADNFLQNYQQMVMTLSARQQIPPQKSLGDIAKYQKPASADDHLQAVAQNILGKWKHQLSPFDKTSAFRLDIYNIAKVCRKLADEIMNLLEDGFDRVPISSKVLELGTNIFKMKTLMTGLSSTIKGIGHQPQFQSMLERGLLTDYGVGLDPKQKMQLQKMLERKQLSDISRMYGSKPSGLARLLGLDKKR